MRKPLIKSSGVRHPINQDSLLLNKLTKSTKTAPKGSGVNSTVQLIKLNVEKYLGKFRDEVESCRDLDKLRQFIDKAIANDILAIDTETTGLDCLMDKIIGVCLYTPGEKALYIPIRHYSYVTGQLLSNQISEKDIKEQLQRLVDSGVQTVFHNAKFDMRMLQNDLGVIIEQPTWDTMIAAKLLNNLEPANLKYQYFTHIEKSNKEYDFEGLFKTIDNKIIPIEIFTLYAATDPLITYRLYQYQQDEFKKYPGIFKVFDEIEMPLIRVVCNMENTGIGLDVDYAKTLSQKYQEKEQAILAKINKELLKYSSAILNYKSLNPKNRLSDPINIGSPAQLAILFYDILHVGIIDEEKPRGTGEEILAKIKEPIAGYILKYREVEKLLGTYIDKLPKVINPRTKRIHASFNQIGADTGRFSSSDPNLQNIPSHDTSIRPMFCAAPGYVLLGSDFSQQEPKLLTYYTQDPNMLKAYADNKDLYAKIAAMSFHKSYEDCLEFYPEGTKIQKDGKEIVCGYKTVTNKEGKARRNAAKSILLGVMYGRGANSIAEQLNCTTKEANDIIQSFYKAFPTVKDWMDKTVADAKKNGFVETFYGRRRYIDGITLPEYEFTVTSQQPNNFNPLSFSDDVQLKTELSDFEKVQYIKKLNNCRGWKEREMVKMEASKNGVKIKDNGGYIANATRQCVNSRIQGGAADQSKLAMLNIYRNKELNDLGFKLLIGVHDELIGECPIENAKRCAELLSDCMTSAGQDILKIPAKCDVAASYKWYGEEVTIDNL